MKLNDSHSFCKSFYAYLKYLIYILFNLRKDHKKLNKKYKKCEKCLFNKLKLKEIAYSILR